MMRVGKVWIMAHKHRHVIPGITGVEKTNEPSIEDVPHGYTIYCVGTTGIGCLGFSILFHNLREPIALREISAVSGDIHGRVNVQKLPEGRGIA